MKRITNGDTYKIIQSKSHTFETQLHSSCTKTPIKESRHAETHIDREDGIGIHIPFPYQKIFAKTHTKFAS